MPHEHNGATLSRLLLVSNRLPVTIHHEAGTDPTLARSAGGLATALARPHAERDSLWIGWPGAAVRSAALRQHLERRLRDDYRCVPVFLSAQNIQRYYDGVSNRALWPLLPLFQAHMRYNEARSRDASPERGRQHGARSLTELLRLQDAWHTAAASGHHTA